MPEFGYAQFQKDVDAMLREETLGLKLEPNVFGVGVDLKRLRELAKSRSPDRGEGEPQAVARALENPGVPAMIEDKSVREYLCPVLKSLSGDVFDIAKVSTPILVSLSLAGAISISLSPVLFAGVFIVVARMGVAAYCADCPTQ